MTAQGETRVPDSPGVLVPPPLLFGAAVLIGLAIDRWLLPAGFGLPPVPRYVLAGVFVIAGLAPALAAMRLFGRAGTHVEPWKPTTALVTSGIYARTRNPIYVGMILFQAGLALLFDSLAVLLMLVPVIPILGLGVIAREERYLTAKFPVDYPAYCARVRRWL